MQTKIKSPFLRQRHHFVNSLFLELNKTKISLLKYRETLDIKSIEMVCIESNLHN